MFSAAGHVHRGQRRGGHLGVVREEGVEEGEDGGDGERFGESPPSASDRADEEERRLTFAVDFKLVDCESKQPETMLRFSCEMKLPV